MTTVNDLRTAGGAGDPDDTAALRLDVVLAAEAWADACYTDIGVAMERSEDLERAVRRYRAAVKRSEGKGA